MDTCIFCKIRDRIIPKEFTYEDEDIMVFPDINPIKPIHLLIAPKKHIEDLLMMKLVKITQNMVKKLELQSKGYRAGINGGGAQLIDHLHIHLIGPLNKGAKM